tara:strand:- start:714 stop:1574 length:861 start_codon:yes stop_codon:yes gene_type:complete
METGTEVMNMNEMDAIVAAFNADDTEALMEASGQSAKPTGQTGLPRININYDAETEDGKSLPRGSWKMYMDGRFIYSEEVTIRPILRTFEYSVWDQESGTFSSKSVQKPTISGMFPDTVGGNKCGRLTRDEEDRLAKDDIEYLNSRAVVCNQVIYLKVSGSFKDVDGNAVDVSDQPAVAYFKRSGFKPINDFINGLSKQKKLMQKCEVSLTTHRHKNGSVTFWTPVPTLKSEVAISDQDKELMGMFAETVKGHNENVMNQHREAAKLLSDDSDMDLAADFDNANAA